MAFCGSGSRSRQYQAQFFDNPKIRTQIDFSMLEAELFLRKLASHFRFFDFCIPFYVGFGSKSGYGIHSGSGSLRQKVAVPAVPVQQQSLLQRVPVTGINLIPARSCREDGTCPPTQQWAADAGSLKQF
jgi:hypothetical protein